MSKREKKLEFGWLRKDFIYTPSENTNVLEAMKRTGWQPPSEYRTDYLFGKGVKGDE